MKWWECVIIFIAGFPLGILFIQLRNREIKATVREELMKINCSGCKNLGYYTDGSPFCAKLISHACIESGFSMKETGR